MKKIVPIWPWPMHPKVAEVVNAIEEITPVEALPGGPGPILAIRDAPPFVADALVVARPERVAEAVKIITGDGIELVSVRESLGRMMGGVELPPERVEIRTTGVKFQ